jgi:hypothetical protein
MAIEWTPNKFGSGSTATLAPTLTLSVQSDVGTRSGPPPKWRARVFGSDLKGPFETDAEAKSVAERVARKQLAIAVALLS